MTDDDIKRMHLETTGFDLDASESALIDFARVIEQASRRAALEEAAKACMRATPDAQTRKAIGDAAHYLACAVAIRALANGEPYD